MIIYNYVFIGLLLLGAIVFAFAPLLVVWLIAPRKRSLAKGDTYECGVKTYGETWVRFRIQYYIYALMFVVFDIETVFLYPWAVSYAGLGTFALVEMIIFLVILLRRPGLRVGQGGSPVGLSCDIGRRAGNAQPKGDAYGERRDRLGLADSLRPASAIAGGRAELDHVGPLGALAAGRLLRALPGHRGLHGLARAEGRPPGSRTGSAPTGSGRWGCSSRSPTRSS